MTGFSGGGHGTPRHGRLGQFLAARGPAGRPHPMALPLKEPATNAAPAPTKAEAHVTAGPKGDGASGQGGWEQPAGGLARRLVGRTSEP